MDTDADWSASALFSPSKAKAQQARAKDWAFVDAWLAKKYGSERVPPVERNEETLHALLSLANFNGNADEQADLIERVEKATLNASSKRNASEDKTLQTLLKHLSQGGRESLDALAEAGTLLGSTAIVALGERISDLTLERFDKQERARRAQVQQDALKREISRISRLAANVKDEAFPGLEDLPEKTTEWLRSTKHLKIKLGEYDERLAASRGEKRPLTSIEEVVRQTKELEVQNARVTELNSQLDAFRGLPSDPKSARKKVETARKELRDLTAKRDRLFEGLADP